MACSVASYSLFFNELDVGDYLTYCKVQPPFRGEADRMALIDGLRRGAIDAVVSAHDPQPTEDKRLPIAEAAYGAVGLETLLPALLSIALREEIPLAVALKPVTSCSACRKADWSGAHRLTSSCLTLLHHGRATGTICPRAPRTRLSMGASSKAGSCAPG